jgi:hypothetical protein
VFSYDSAIAAAVLTPAQSVDDVLRTLRSIDAICADTDGLKWFNWLYLQVTEAVAARVVAGGFASLKWLADLDVRFAQLYFDALRSTLAGARCPDCWRVMFEARANTRLARLQLALAGMNAHINRDLPEAIVATSAASHTTPAHATAQYVDYTSVNSTLESLIETARTTLRVRLPGDPLPTVSRLEDVVAGWKVSAAREAAWDNAEALWNLPPLLSDNLKHSIDGLTTVVGKALLIPVD